MGVETQESYGSPVRCYRRDVELTQEALAERADLSVPLIRAIETESTHRPRHSTVRLLLDALAIPADEQSVFLQAAVGLEPNATAPAAPTAGGRPPSASRS